jgi:hypothetical protein
VGRSPLGASGLPLFFGVADPHPLGLVPPALPGRAFRTVARSLSTMQKEALVASGPSS